MVKIAPEGDDSGLHLEALRRCAGRGAVEWRKHALKRALERGIPRSTVLQTLVSGECIHRYTDDTPFPSALFLGFHGRRPVHVVAALDAASQVVYIITVYEPNTSVFESDFRTRRKNDG